jgi:hypothetical protein
MVGKIAMWAAFEDAARLDDVLPQFPSIGGRGYDFDEENRPPVPSADLLLCFVEGDAGGGTGIAGPTGVFGSKFCRDGVGGFLDGLPFSFECGYTSLQCPQVLEVAVD